MPEAPTTTPEVKTPPPAQPAAAVRREPTILPTLFGEGYDIYERKPGAFIGSYSFVIAALVAFLLLAKFVPKPEPEEKLTAIEISLPTPPPNIVGNGGGGGNHDPKPATKGVLPKQARMQITPPRVDPKPAALEVPPTIVGPDKPAPILAQLGDPLGKIGAPSNGQGSGGGIGNGNGTGVGDGRGAGRFGSAATKPVATYAPDPEYSEEARKAKYQGVVVLSLVVGADGIPRDIHVARSLGLGLDEKAIESVKTWRFDPGRNKQGVAVAVPMTIEVEFHLY